MAGLWTATPATFCRAKASLVLERGVVAQGSRVPELVATWDKVAQGSRVPRAVFTPSVLLPPPFWRGGVPLFFVRRGPALGRERGAERIILLVDERRLLDDLYSDGLHTYGPVDERRLLNDVARGGLKG